MTWLKSSFSYVLTPLLQRYQDPYSPPAVSVTMLGSDHPPNIYIVGPQCTGKTTIVNELRGRMVADNLLSSKEPRIISEVARSILRQNHDMAKDIRSSPDRSLDLQKLIIDGQAEEENRALQAAT